MHERARGRRRHALVEPRTQHARHERRACEHDDVAWRAGEVGEQRIRREQHDVVRGGDAQCALDGARVHERVRAPVRQARTHALDRRIGCEDLGQGAPHRAKVLCTARDVAGREAEQQRGEAARGGLCGARARSELERVQKAVPAGHVCKREEVRAAVRDGIAQQRQGTQQELRAHDARRVVRAALQEGEHLHHHKEPAVAPKPFVDARGAAVLNEHMVYVGGDAELGERGQRTISV